MNTTPDPTQENYKRVIPTSRGLRKYDAVSTEVKEQEEIDTLYDTYYRTALLHYASESNRKNQLKNSSSQIKFLAQEIDSCNQKVRNIKQRIKLILFLEENEKQLRKKIPQYMEIGKINSDKIQQVLNEYKDGINGLPIPNMQLPQTKAEGELIINMLDNMVKEIESPQNREKAVIPAIELVESLKETNAIADSFNELTQTCQKNMSILKNLTKEEMFLKVSVNYDPELSWDLADHISG